MNSKNIVTRFLQAWQDKDYQAMQDLSIGEVDKSLLADISSFSVQRISKVGSRRRAYVHVVSGGRRLDFSFLVVPESGPFEAPSASGVEWKSLADSLSALKQPISTEMSAKEAVEHIKGSDLEDLEGFVGEDEKRTTVLEAIEEKGAQAKPEG